MATVTLILDGETVPVTNLFDADGEPVEAWDDAFTFVAGPRADGSWLSAETADFQKARLN
jgi:hypothetical protein